VGLPSTKSDPSATFGDDVQAVRDATVAETTQQHDVVVVVHSYGGQVGNSEIKGLTPLGQDTAGSSGHVLGIAMIATGFTVTGVSFLDGAGGKPPPSWKLDPKSGFAIVVAEPREMFYHDLPRGGQ
jgi:hypothetical protein